MTTEMVSERKRTSIEKQNVIESPAPEPKHLMTEYFVVSPGKSSASDKDDKQTKKIEEKDTCTAPSTKNVKEAPSLHKKGHILIVNDSDIARTKEKIKKPKKVRNRVKKTETVEKANNNTVVNVTESPKSTSQSTITQHFQIRRSERRTKSQVKKDQEESRTKRILTGDEEGLEVKVVEGKGRAVFASRPFAKGELVCEYAGDLISLKEAQERETEYSQSTEYGCYMYYFAYKEKRYCVDATKESDRLGRLLNHSKTGSNVHTELFPIKSIPHLILVASQNISIGEELLYDYGDRSKESVASHPWLKM